MVIYFRPILSGCHNRTHLSALCKFGGGEGARSDRLRIRVRLRFRVISITFISWPWGNLLGHWHC